MYSVQCTAYTCHMIPSEHASSWKEDPFTCYDGTRAYASVRTGCQCWAFQWVGGRKRCGGATCSGSYFKIARTTSSPTRTRPSASNSSGILLKIHQNSVCFWERSDFGLLIYVQVVLEKCLSLKPCSSRIYLFFREDLAQCGCSQDTAAAKPADGRNNVSIGQKAPLMLPGRAHGLCWAASQSTGIPTCSIHSKTGSKGDRREAHHQDRIKN